MTNDLQTWIDNLEFENEQIHQNLMYIPITSSRSLAFDFLTLEKGLKDKLVEVKELEEGASVPELKVINRSEKYLLIFDGEHLIGAMQNRIVNKTIIVKPKSEIVMPVSCTEQGRWQSKSRGFSKSKYYASSYIRRILKHKLDAQHEVWSDVREKMRSYGVHSDTSSLEDVYTEIDSSFEDYKDKISTVANQVGFTIFINGEFAGLDVVGDSELFYAIQESLINSYLMDAMYDPKLKTKKADPKKRAMEILGELTRVPSKKGEKIGAENREELMGKIILGEIIRFNGKPVHLALFPNMKTENSGTE